jgi:hypothetical protein
MGLAERVQDRLLGIVSHSCGADFVDRHAWHLGVRSETYVFCARRFEHFRSSYAGVSHQGGFVFAMGHAYAQRGNSPGIFESGIDLAEVIEVCERLAESAKRNVIRAEFHCLFIISPEPLSIGIERGLRTTLKTVPPKEVRVLAGGRGVAKAYNVNSIWPVWWIRTRQNI